MQSYYAILTLKSITISKPGKANGTGMDRIQGIKAKSGVLLVIAKA
jgi:hypothetical protein